MHKNLSDDKKVEILMDALKERYESMHKIRERVQNTGVWVLGFVFAIGSWIIQTEDVFSCTKKFLFVGAIVIAFAIVRFRYLGDLNRGFKGQQRTAAKLEKTLGLFTPGVFDSTDQSIYPSSWEKAGTEEGEGKFFTTTYMLIYFGVAFLLIAIFLNSQSFEHGHFMQRGLEFYLYR